MFPADVVELDDGVPDRVQTGGVGSKHPPLHPRHGQEVPLGAPLDHHIWRKEKDVKTRGLGNVQSLSKRFSQNRSTAPYREGMKGVSLLLDHAYRWLRTLEGKSLALHCLELV